MLKHRYQVSLFVALLLVLAGGSLQARAQAIPAATQNAIDVGAAVSWGTSDEWPKPPNTSMGITAFGDIEVYRHIGPEADVHLMSLSTPHTLVEDSFLFGPRYALHYGRFEPYGKFLFGLAHASVQKPTYVPNTPGTFLAIAFGGGINYRLLPRIDVRGDFEYQDWLSFSPSGLTPTVTSIGVAYRFH